MGDTTESIKQEAQERELKEKHTKILRRRTAMINKMKASGTFKRILIWIQYKWFTTLLLSAVLIIGASLVGVIARIVWEILKAIWSVSL